MKMDQEEAQLRLLKIGQLSSDGAKHHHGDDLEKAVECYDEAYKLARDVHDDKTERTCSFNLGAAYIAIGNPHVGLEYLHKATPPDGQRDERSNGDLYFNMGLGHEKLDDERKALEDYERAYEEYVKYERDKTNLQIQCLEKCLQIYQSWKAFSKAADICQQMADVFTGSDSLSRADRLCERASQLRLANKKNEASLAAQDCINVLNDVKPQGQDCTIAGKILNDLGLVFTQLQQYDDATRCFEKAVELVRSSHKMNPQLEAVVLQNLGAAYNFDGEYQRAIKFHEDAAEKYAKINYRNGQGQCFTNLAFALSQLGGAEMKQAELAFHHALQASKDTGDNHMKWQALEGLGAVNYNQGNVREAVDYFIEALKYVGENKPASERIKTKMLHAMGSGGTELSGALHRGQGYIVNQGTPMAASPENTLYMPPHGPVEEHAQLSATPRSQVRESTIVPTHYVPIAGEHPAMSSVQESSQKPRRFVQMRKHDSVGPHFPKVSRGLASGTYDSPRIQSLKRGSVLEGSSSASDSSSESESSSSGDSSDEGDGADQALQQEQRLSSEKIEQIFTRPPVSGPGRPDTGKHLSMYEAHLREKEENEDSEEDSSDESSSSDEETEASQQDKTHDKQRYAPPPLPTQSLPSTAQVSNTLHIGTYLTPDPRTEYTVADVHQQSVSPHRVATQPQTAESPLEESSSSDDNDDDDDKNDDSHPYAKVDSATKCRQAIGGQGNDNASELRSKQRQRSDDGRKSENFFDSDRSSVCHSETNSGAGTYHSLNFEREDVGHEGDQSAMNIEQLPRGQREVIMAQYHRDLNGQGQEAPPVPTRNEEKSSKTCVIM